MSEAMESELLSSSPFAVSKITGSDNQTELTAAMVAVQAEIVDPPKDQHNPAVGARYASLQSGLPGYRQLLAAHSVWIMQNPTTDLDAGRVGVTTRLQHTSGEWLEGYFEAEIPSVPTSSAGTSKVNATQMVLLATAYVRRGALHALLCVAAEDNDGSTAGTGADAAGVTRLGTAPQAESEQAATAPETEPAADGAGGDDLPPDSMAAQATADQADHHMKTLQEELLREFARINADFDDVKAACQTLAGVDTIYELSAEQLQKALDDIRARFPVEAPAS